MEVVPIVYYENTVEKTHITDVKYANRFLQEVKPDLLCVSIWTQSGGKKEVKEIRYDVLKKLQEDNPKQPFMIHGWSFIDDEIIRNIIDLGVTKININAELRYAYSNKLKSNIEVQPEEYAPYRLLSKVKEEIWNVVQRKIKLMWNI